MKSARVSKRTRTVPGPLVDGPASPLARPLNIRGAHRLDALRRAGLEPKAAETAAKHAPRGRCVAWGIPLAIGSVHVLRAGSEVRVPLANVRARWFICCHTSPDKPDDAPQLAPDGNRGQGRLGEHLADYTLLYADGSRVTQPIRRRYEINHLSPAWGENCFAAVADHKPQPIGRQPDSANGPRWGNRQFMVQTMDRRPWTNWLFAWENPHPDTPVSALLLRGVQGTIVFSALSASDVATTPLRWERRRKACVQLPKLLPAALRDHQACLPDELDAKHFNAICALDLGQVITVRRHVAYPDKHWARSQPGSGPDVVPDKALIEYAAHPEARFHFPDGRVLPASPAAKERRERIVVVAPAHQRVRISVVNAATGRAVPVRLHVHGAAGEYLSPLDRHRQINAEWFQDYSAELLKFSEPPFTAKSAMHPATYIGGSTVLDLPLGPVYIEVSKGFEIRPVRLVKHITRRTEEIAIQLEQVLPWRARGWVSADTHVHFLSPHTAHLEGAAEGVNVVNLLASQWGELFTNIGDFDGRNTLDSIGDGEHLVRVGTENRQHVLGHISLLGYDGAIIAPVCSGGPDEAALGDPLDVLLCEWARRCRQQNGLVVIPHFPNPRAENAAAIVSGLVDGLEMSGWLPGISPYSLYDYYRYLNCGYQVPIVGGTDKMFACMPVGKIRTYARIPDGQPFSYESWKQAIRRGETFATTGPLLEFNVEGKPAGARIEIGSSGGHVDVTWRAASVLQPMTQVQLIVNGEVREAQRVNPRAAEGAWRVPIERSCWLALIVRMKTQSGEEVIGAHSSAVMAFVAGSELFACKDAITILDQIEGSVAYLDCLGTRAEATTYRRMRAELTAAHRTLHNRLHHAGIDHPHTPVHTHAS